MPRVKRGTKGRQRHKKLLKLAKGNVGGRRKGYRQARSTVEKGLTYAYRDRKVRKREFRGLWIVRINAAARTHGVTYSRLMAGLKKAGSDLDRTELLEDVERVRDRAAACEPVDRVEQDVESLLVHSGAFTSRHAIHHGVHGVLDFHSVYSVVDSS